MRHWVEELSNREQNRAAAANQTLGRLAFDRTVTCINDCLEIYNGSHPPDPRGPIRSEPSDNGTLLTVHAGFYPRRICFTFRAGTPEFTRYGFFNNQAVTDHGHVYIEDGKMHTMIDGHTNELEIVIRHTLQPILFPDYVATARDDNWEYYAVIGG